MASIFCSAFAMLPASSHGPYACCTVAFRPPFSPATRAGSPGVQGPPHACAEASRACPGMGGGEYRPLEGGGALSARAPPVSRYKVGWNRLLGPFTPSCIPHRSRHPASHSVINYNKEDRGGGKFSKALARARGLEKGKSVCPTTVLHKCGLKNDHLSLHIKKNGGTPLAKPPKNYFFKLHIMPFITQFILLRCYTVGCGHICAHTVRAHCGATAGVSRRSVQAAQGSSPGGPGGGPSAGFDVKTGGGDKIPPPWFRRVCGEGPHPHIGPWP